MLETVHSTVRRLEICVYLFFFDSNCKDWVVVAYWLLNIPAAKRLLEMDLLR